MTHEPSGGRLILQVVAGSRAHGLATEESDTDTRGVCIPGVRYLLGLSTFEQSESEGGDHVVFSIAKFVRLALQGNPNIIETLYTEEEHVLLLDQTFGKPLLDIRDVFLSRKVGERFMRYAVGQLERIERGRNARGRTSRNPKRAALEQQYGYDTKHAMHLCRLLKMGGEILSEGVVRVRRPDAGWLLGIRRGAMSYEELVAWTRDEIARLPELMERSALPREPNAKLAEDVLIELQREYLRG